LPAGFEREKLRNYRLALEQKTGPPKLVVYLFSDFKSHAGDGAMGSHIPEPVGIQPFDPLFEPPAIAPSMWKIRSNHLLGLTPMKVEFSVPFTSRELSYFPDIKSPKGHAE
jgi:hypothetical protein